MNKIHTLLIASALLITSTAAHADGDDATGKPTISGSVFGGGRMANVNNNNTTETVTATIDIYASTIKGGVFGGNDITGAVAQGSSASSQVNIHDKCSTVTSLGEVYGGGNGYYKYKIGDADPIAIGGITDDNKSTAVASGTTITVLDSNGNTVATFTTSAATTYGGLLPTLATTSVKIGDDSGNQNNIYIGEVYGGAKNAYVTEASSVTVNSGTMTKVFAENNYGGSIEKTELTINATKTPAVEPTKDDFGSFDWTGVGDITFTDGVASTDGYGIKEAYGGGNAVDVSTAAQVNMIGGYVKTLFGGNNLADMSSVPSILFAGGNIGTSYGGGNAGDMQGCEAAHLDISQYLNNDLFVANNNLPAFKNAGITFTDFCNTSDYLYFYGAETLLQQGEGKSLKIGTVYGGCRAANVDLSTYVRVKGCDYIGTVYGGCDMAGSVGAKPTESKGVTTITNADGTKTALTKSALNIEYYDIATGNGYAVKKTLPANFPVINLSSIVTLMGNTVSGNLFAGGNGDYQYVADGDYTKVYASSDASHTNLLTSFKTADVDRPWTVSSIAAMEGGTLSGTLYGGGNNADVGQEDSEGRVYVLLGKTARGILSKDATGPVVSGTVYAGGKKSNVYGTVDVLVKAGCDINTLYAGNDISGQVTGSNRGNYLAGSEASAITTVLYGTDNNGNHANNTYCGWRLDKPNGDENAKAQVYVRVEGAGNDADGTARSAAQITTLYGGSNGDYDYTTETSQYYGLTKPVSKSNFLDVKGIVETCYGGGNAADVEISNTYITGDALIGTAFAGGNSATVTAEANLWLNCKNDRGTQDYVDGSDATKIPNTGTIFGGNNVAAMAIVPRVYLWSGSAKTVYGGGNAGDMTGYEAGAADLSQYIAEGAFDNLNAYAHTSVTPENLIFFYSTQVVVDKDAKSTDNSLAVGTVYGGCKAADVDRSSYVLYRSATYMGDIYGGCDIAGKVGKSGNTGTLATAMPVYAYEPTAADPAHHLAYDTNLPSGLPFFNTASYVRIWGGTVSGTIYGGGNGAYDYTSSQYSSYSSNKPAVFATGISLEGGTAAGNVYGGGNNADVGSDADSWRGTSYLLIGKTAKGVGQPVVNGKVYAGCKMSDMYGIMDVIVKAGSTLNELYAGNDIAGQVKGVGRATSVLGSTFPTGWTTALYGTSHNAFDGTSLTGNAQVYVRVEGAGKDGDNADQPAAKINTVFGGGNGYYTYGTVADGKTPVYEYGTTNLVATYMGDASTNLPSQNTSWLDISGQVGTVYGGGNAADNNYTNVCIYGPAVIGTTETKGAVYGGCKSANVTHRTNVHVEGDDTKTPTVNGNVFGGCDISGNVGDCTSDCSAENVHLLADHSNASVGHAHVDVLAGTITGRVFGGGNGLEDATGTAYYTGTPTVTGTKPADIFTYPDGSTYDSKSIAGKQLPVCQNTYVVVKNATVGSSTGSDTHTVFGGGQGAGTKVMHNAFMNLGTTTDNTTVNGTLYGGSYAGFVNSTCSDCTQTTLLGNGSTTTVDGDIYGGSYGNYVRGKIVLNINNIQIGDGDAEAHVYAGNNNAGQPECEADVNIIGNYCNVSLYGGGNHADFYGTTRLTFTKGDIGYLYGGGNHAPVYGNTIVEVLGGHVCHDVFGGGNEGAVLVNKASDAEHNSYGKDYGGNTLVIVRDDCLQTKADSNGKTPGEEGYVPTFASDPATGNYLANRGTTSYFNTKADGTEMSDKVDPYTADKQMYVLKPNGTTPVKSTVTIDGNVYGGGNNADVTGKATVIIGNKK